MDSWDSPMRKCWSRQVGNTPCVEFPAAVWMSALLKSTIPMFIPMFMPTPIPIPMPTPIPIPMPMFAIVKLPKFMGMAVPIALTAVGAATANVAGCIGNWRKFSVAC